MAGAHPADFCPPYFLRRKSGNLSSERRAGDVEVIAAYLHKWRCLDSLSNSLLRRLASVAYLEDLDDGVTLYRQGDRGTNWYFILSGEIVMATCSDRSDNKDASSSFRHLIYVRDDRLLFYLSHVHVHFVRKFLSADGQIDKVEQHLRC
ncbi:hypothetical protein OUZ56_007910 [Daphnia magna]|uniref:Cyclic nucleotide-binding domain-containing protein n=1 Tax=Daphnia magna TaxID=35525 RepID=A0ABR0ABE0_9CRUS|nr:hypothetical protein OUZ56_007910 [Daphnia magna]